MTLNITFFNIFLSEKYLFYTYYVHSSNSSNSSPPPTHIIFHVYSEIQQRIEKNSLSIKPDTHIAHGDEMCLNDLYPSMNWISKSKFFNAYVLISNPSTVNLSSNSLPMYHLTKLSILFNMLGAWEGCYKTYQICVECEPLTQEFENVCPVLSLKELTFSSC